MKISESAIRVLSAEQAVFPEAQDALDRLAFLIGPVIATIGKDRRLTSQILQEAISDNFGLSVPVEVNQALLFRLAKHGFATQSVVDKSSIFLGLVLKHRQMVKPSRCLSGTFDFLLRIKHYCQRFQMMKF